MRRASQKVEAAKQPKANSQQDTISSNKRKSSKGRQAKAAANLGGPLMAMRKSRQQIRKGTAA
jgi:hypothetical protein